MNVTLVAGENYMMYATLGGSADSQTLTAFCTYTTASPSQGSSDGAPDVVSSSTLLTPSLLGCFESLEYEEGITSFDGGNSFVLSSSLMEINGDSCGDGGASVFRKFDEVIQRTRNQRKKKRNGSLRC